MEPVSGNAVAELLPPFLVAFGVYMAGYAVGRYGGKRGENLETDARVIKLAENQNPYDWDEESKT